ncbi:K319L-like protein [Mya arenaria]|uniref:K319L-like protein n=1 Tax=Mya arenaria TaxID=6604 RepID=A0ABY7FAB0_MYAAR|nr:K319L-like protein [Mya arenaria]
MLLITICLSSFKKASLAIKEDPHKKDLMELELEADITTFTQDNKVLAAELEIYDVCFLRVLFYAMNVLRDTRTYRSGVSTLAQLKEKLLSSANVLDFTVANLDTLVCQKNCSNHGHCDMKTKLCICEPFWTANVILYRLHGESNCGVVVAVAVCEHRENVIVKDNIHGNYTIFLDLTFLGIGTQSSSTRGVQRARFAEGEILYGSKSSFIIVLLRGRAICCNRSVAIARYRLSGRDISITLGLGKAFKAPGGTLKGLSLSTSSLYSVDICLGCFISYM